MPRGDLWRVGWQKSERLSRTVWPDGNIGLWPVCPADMLSAAGDSRRGLLGYSGLQTRWAHRLQVYVPTNAATGLALLQPFPDDPCRASVPNVRPRTHTPPALLRACLVRATRGPMRDERDR